MHIPVGVPVPSIYPSLDEAPKVKSSKLVGFPPGLSQAVEQASKEFQARFWICDNSGSMQSHDGTRMIPREDGSMAAISSTRWAELGDTVMRIGEVALALRCRTDFHLLTPIQGTARPRQFLTLEEGGGIGSSLGLSGLKSASEGRCSLADLREVMDGTPYYSTPLTEAVQTISRLIEPSASALRSRGQRVLVVVATDGRPDNPHTFVHAMRELQRLPVLVVVRLCTSDSSVVDYWSSVDKELEAPLDALDDLVGEAREIRRFNRWLTYGHSLHTAREFGLVHHLFDRLDEGPLLPSQVKELCELILGCRLPEPQVDKAAFFRALTAALQDAGEVFDPLSRRMKPWVDLDALEAHLNPSCANVVSQLCRELAYTLGV
uniref:VWFA domain-containing protein n=1 Tax=Prymnesium polylepis TaxID=72548 RepID=A0A6V4A1U7_9EUKA|mmetsp:Transcript_23922/g.59354  ORF Transcript_23922/g.59354 Transcript_23922/m.59354 type:complete len:377 (+) Transcript_23922:74-1204(+)